MKKIIFLILILMISINSYAWKHDKWTICDTTLQSVFTATMIIDCSQTLWAQKNVPGIEDYNPILRSHYTPKFIITYFVSCTILHTTIAYILPKPYRTIFQSCSIGLEVYVVQSNYKAMLSYGWSL